MTQPPRIEDVVDYLGAHGWTVTTRWRNATVWSWGEFDVLVPPNDDLADTPARLRELVRCVADAEGRPPRTVGRDMAMPSVDVVSYRAPDSDGRVALPAGLRAVRAARNLVAASARELGAGEAVEALLEHSLLSLSEEVFGVDIALPVARGEQEPLGRATALRVLRTSTLVVAALRSADSLEQVLVRESLSEDACLALADLGGQHRESAFELGFRWSRLLPRPDDAVGFPRGAGQRLRAASKRSETEQTSAVGVVEGPVTSLSDDEEGTRWRIGVRGVLHVDDVASGRQRVVPVLLGDAHRYERALAAHREGRIVRVEGAVTVIRGARGITAGPTEFTVTDRTRTP
jgi:hypothetical protein